MRRSIVVAMALSAFLALDTGRAVRLAAQEPTGGGVQVLESSQLVAAFPGLRKTIAVRFEGKPLAQALREVAAKADLAITYSDLVLPKEHSVWLTADRIRADQALQKILSDAGLQLLPLSNGRLVVVAGTRGEVAANGTIVGRVTDAKTKAPLAGATVVVEGTSRSATTGNDGRYRIADVAPGTYSVRSRYIGYAPSSTTVTVSADQEAVADIALEKSAQRLDEVVTTGTVAPTEVKELPSPVSVITSDQIRQANMQHVDDLFRGAVPGALAWDKAGLNFYSGINVRGTTTLIGQPGIKTYVDGVEVTDPIYVMAIDPTSIDHVEIIRGPQASTLYGSQALNGVMQIFTKKGAFERPLTLEATMVGGVVQTQWISGKSSAPKYQYDMSASSGTQDLSYEIGGKYAYTGEWVDEYYGKDLAVHGGARTVLGGLTAELSGSYYSQELGNPRYPWFDRFAAASSSFAKPQNEVTRQPHTTVGATLDYQMLPHWTHRVTVGYDHQELDQFNNAPRFITPDDSLLTIYLSQGSKASVGYNNTLELHPSNSVLLSLTTGLDHYHYSANDVGLTAQRNNGPLDGGTFFFADRFLSDNTGYFGQAQLSILDALFLTGGLRAEQNTNFGDKYGLAWAPRVGASYVRGLGSVSLKTRASYGKAIRPPDPLEKDGSVGGGFRFLPNLSLGPEAQRGWDAGFDVYWRDRISLGVTYYRQQALDLIDRVILGSEGALIDAQFQNVGRIQNRGWEFNGTVLLTNALSLDGTLSITTSTVAVLSPTYGGDLEVGDHLLGIPHHNGGARVSWTFPGTHLSLGGTYVGSWTNYDFIALNGFFAGVDAFRGSLRDYRMQYPSFVKLNFTASRDLGPKLQGVVAVDNLTNSYSVEEGNFQVNAGRRTTVGLRVRL